MKLAWDKAGEHFFETGTEKAVLFVRNALGVYEDGVPWNGLTGVTASPTGAEFNYQYANNKKYLNLKSVEEFGGTIKAFTYPDEWERCDGSASPVAGLTVNQQGRLSFGLSYETRIGNELEGVDLGFKVNLVWGADAMPSERDNTTINESPEAMELAWEFMTIATAIAGINPLTGKDWKPTSTITLNSTTLDPETLSDFLDVLYGTAGTEPTLPSPEEVIAFFAGAGAVAVNMIGANAPDYDEATHVITLPAVANITWQVDGVEVAAGAQPALGVGEEAYVTAHPAIGYYLTGDEDWAYAY